MSCDIEERVREMLHEYAATTRRPADRLDLILADGREHRYPRRPVAAALLVAAVVIVFGAVGLSKTPSRERLRVTGVPTVPTTSRGLTSSSTVATTTPSTPTGQTVTANPATPLSLSQGTVRFPQDGVPNDNKSIGPFCCTGRTATILDQGSSFPVGYIYYLDWEGQSYNVDTCFATPSIKILVSGLADLADESSPQMKSEVLIYAKDYVPGISRTTIAGKLSFRVTVDGAVIRNTAGSPSFYCPTSTSVRVDITIVP